MSKLVGNPLLPNTILGWKQSTEVWDQMSPDAQRVAEDCLASHGLAKQGSSVVKIRPETTDLSASTINRT
jgi:hypothetical protein